MDPATMTSISSVFGLMATFLQERQGRKEAQVQATRKEFIEWLNRKRHTLLLEHLQSNNELMLAIQHLLNTGQDELLERFDRLESMLALILGRSDGWGALAQSLIPNAGLSDQACSILRQFDECDASEVYTDHDRGLLKIYPLDGKHGQVPFKLPERRFVEDDLEILVGLGLLIQGWGDHPRYKITREAIKLAQSFETSSNIK
jgi:hypothetical protein